MKGIGNTPLVKLEKLTDSDSADIYIKLESANPTGSMKDRMALSMIEAAERRGDLKVGGTVVDYTGGSTGSSLAMICSAKGYNAHFVSSDAFSEEKIQTMRAFGAQVDLVPSENGKITAQVIDTALHRVREISRQNNTFYTDQFKNVDNRNAYHYMAQEIMNELGSSVDEFIAGVGTGGCFSGNSEIFKSKIPAIRCIPVEPFNVRTLSGGDTSGTHRLEGMGAGFIPDICRLDLADEVIAVKDEDAMETARQLARVEGIFGGTSSGANVWAALQRAKIIGKGKTIVTVICDSGLKYLQGDLFKIIPQ